jgi:hypothetical protein
MLLFVLFRAAEASKIADFALPEVLFIKKFLT